ncbi:MAG: GntR family transcriptional regulator [Magnetovibrionaceae bacterium]
MPFQRIRHPKISDAIVEQLEALILEGVLEPGDRLPPERELASELDVSRPSLREAIHRLEMRGLLEAKQGGGTFVKTILASSFTDPLVHLLQSNSAAAMDYVEFRKSIESTAAYYAALRATDSDREILEGRFKAMIAAHEIDDPTQEAECDADFHLAVAEAAHNVVLLHIARALFDLLRKGVFYNRNKLYKRSGVRDILLKQHEALYRGVMNGDPEAASNAASAHMAYVQEAMREMDREDGREDSARRRLERLIAENRIPSDENPAMNDEGKPKKPARRRKTKPAAE